MLSQQQLKFLESMTFLDKFKISKLAKHNQNTAEIDSLIDQAVLHYQTRLKTLPEQIVFPENLPVVEKRQDIFNAIRDNQVVIIAGETGSGKTTQIPKICLELGLGVKGFIGHTQPRRLAARSVANRIAEELHTEIGQLVGYKVRFSDQVSDTTLIKLMTDGILLAEIQKDKLLLQYDTIIIDEAHERSLNIDFILGYLKQLLPKRPDLKVIITSATIDVERFSNHFNHAPVVEVSGRTYPVEVRYRPPIFDNNDSEVEKNSDFQPIIDAIDELSAESNGDILIFLTGEREIRDLADTLNKLQLRHTDVLPLYARLSNSEQNRIFQSHTKRRIVLATNVAETSLTVPGIKYVIDPGLARISRYSYRTKVQRLPIEPISQASANQRKGRCGRTSDGICIRLYDEQDFLSRPEFTEPEILRTNLASVILQMTALGLGDIAAFPFVQAPDSKYIRDGIRLLEELGALYTKHHRYHLTDIGKILAQLPIDPRLARMLVEARRLGCTKEIMIITAALSIQDPRERPFDKQQASDEKHRRFADKQSDFISYINLWNYIKTQQQELSGNQFRRLCQKEFLNYLRIREWQDVYTQIRQTIKQLAFPINSQLADYRSLHVALLCGLLSHVGMKELEKHEYIGARNIKFAIFPNSAIFKNQPKWCIASELVETSRLWGRTAAKIEAEWIEPVAKHLVKYSYSEPRWSKKQGTTIANEKVTLFGLPIVASRIVNYSKIDPVLSRSLFIRHALVEGDWLTNHKFYKQNQKLIEEVEDLEHKSRRQDILIDDNELFNFYNQRIDKSVISAKHFDSWWKTKQKTDPDFLNFEKNMLINQSAQSVNLNDFPDFWYQDQLKLPLSYQFDIGDKRDGVTITIPINILNQVKNRGFDWQVPGFREDLVIALIKSLPKSLRKNLVPAPNYAQAFLNRVGATNQPLLETLETEFRKMTGVKITNEDWQLDQIPDYLKMSFSIVDNNKEIAFGKDLDKLKEQLKTQVQQALSSLTEKKSISLEQDNLTDWNFGTLPNIYEAKQKNYVVKAYPTIIDNQNSVSIKLVDSKQEQQRLTKLGLRRLLILNIPSPIKYLHEKLPNKSKLGLYFNSFGTVLSLIDDCIACAVDYLIEKNNQTIENQEQYQQLLDYTKAHINETVVDIAKQVESILTLHFNINKKLKGRVDLSLAFALSDIKQQINNLIYKGFVAKSGYHRLNDIHRYLLAIDKRIEKLMQNASKDRQAMNTVEEVKNLYENWLNSLTENQRLQQQVVNIRWMIEELRVNLFAQQLGTPYPISAKRIKQQIDQVKSEL
ncbi:MULTISPECIES: ATP-dependent RNA helicase HrpA [unclassified Gilliamella]|uniref:ATP-dependent RNA helicase HrpA n=1 Tax=unclassified Gilliamella TaxID=2685620 RepID=UPI00226ABFB1|nr:MULTISPECIES: ATP-dependent RNA helicase HrpA [unclassified Gilliamella]MCX8601406.1 ATP-dependent RNA helicase HrpA [Gilliamella sp. B3722]MCX8608949.1 ATP-dependent RNA helicase HrpA [Gilliamella sp. B3771]MCX8610624.1 ATP-dependent RNA helicase HrpA [Gilliamella sp. B3891]MCX8613137.1 ATP-dependent RNA helicase HrpA [Gilliamella sp. B3773]MCX8615366.1 ATP-dependent RNA helicase HrpA [Gilliamella sp. B3770]